MHTIDRILSSAATLPVDLPLAEPASHPPAAPRRRWGRWLLALFAVGVLISLALAWGTDRRLRQVERELARRQQDTQSQSTEARLMAKQSQDLSRETAAKVALLDARLAEVALQRTQLEDLIQSLSRSRDENLVVDIEAGLRVAQQQAIITGSAEPLVAALKQADERLGRHSQPRLEAVRRAVARDLDRVKAVGVADISALTIKLDEAVRLVDELPMLSDAHPRKEAARPASAASPTQAASGPAAASGLAALWAPVTGGWNQGWETVWREARSLVRVTRIDHPDAALLAPDQAFFVRENLKLRLLNARLALLSRQFDTTQGDLQAAKAMLERYFDPASRRTAVAADLVRQVMASGRNVGLPRPDETLAALSSVAAGR